MPTVNSASSDGGRNTFHPDRQRPFALRGANPGAWRLAAYRPGCSRAKSRVAHTNGRGRRPVSPSGASRVAAGARGADRVRPTGGHSGGTLAARSIIPGAEHMSAPDAEEIRPRTAGGVFGTPGGGGVGRLAAGRGGADWLVGGVAGRDTGT